MLGGGHVEVARNKTLQEQFALLVSQISLQPKHILNCGLQITPVFCLHILSILKHLFSKINTPDFCLSVFHNSFSLGLYNSHFSWLNSNIKHNQARSVMKKKTFYLMCAFISIMNNILLNFYIFYFMWKCK